jgi:phosphoribosyl 1,2-cyclic phosphate phosphodiesterase
MGVPVIGCHCAVCTSPDLRNRRTRTSALLSLGDLRVQIDAGPDFRMQSLAAGTDHLDGVLLTHSHFDHIAGLDDLRPIVRRGATMPIYGSPQTLAEVRSRFAYAFEETSLGSTRPSIELCAVQAPFTIGALQICPLEVIHGTWSITGYRIGNLGYVTDASFIPPASVELLRELDVLVLNALRYEPHPTHFSVDQALAIIAELQPQRAFLVHMTHTIDHAAVDARLPPGVNLAYDGLEIDVH